MDAAEFIKKTGELCNDRSGCIGCPLEDGGCLYIGPKEPEEIVKIVEEYDSQKIHSLKWRGGDHMSDLHIEVCTAVEDILEKRLSLEPCEATYELAAEIVEVVAEKIIK